MGSLDSNPLDAPEVTVKSMTDKTQENFVSQGKQLSFPDSFNRYQVISHFIFHTQIQT